MAVEKHGKEVLARKIVIQPRWEGGAFKGVLIRYFAIADTEFGTIDIGQTTESFKAVEDMTAEEIASYQLFVSDFENKAIKELGCSSVIQN